jgi:hypothetical protein
VPKRPKAKKCRRCRRAPWTCRSCGAKCCEHLCALKKPDGTASCSKCQSMPWVPVISAHPPRTTIMATPADDPKDLFWNSIEAAQELMEGIRRQAIDDCAKLAERAGFPNVAAKIRAEVNPGAVPNLSAMTRLDRLDE